MGAVIKGLFASGQSLYVILHLELLASMGSVLDVRCSGIDVIRPRRIAPLGPGGAAPRVLALDL